MMCCCGKKNKVKQGPIIVTLFGSSGYLGKNVMGPFLEALNSGRIAELRTPTRQPADETMKKFGSEGAKVLQVNFDDISSLKDVLAGSTAVVSCLGTGEGMAEVNEALIRAMTQVGGISVFLPSEFGTNYSRVKEEFQHPIFALKRTVYTKAKAAGLNPIRIYCGDLLEGTFGKWLGFDSTAEVWTIVGSGDVRVAMTSEKDVGRFALEALVMAHGSTVPDELEVFSVQKTLKEYAAIFDSVAGSETKLEFVSMAEAKENYKNTGDFLDLLKLLFAEGTYDYTKAKGNKILNPDEKVWKLRTIEDYAQEIGGRPHKE